MLSGLLDLLDKLSAADVSQLATLALNAGCCMLPSPKAPRAVKRKPENSVGAVAAIVTSLGSIQLQAQPKVLLVSSPAPRSISKARLLDLQGCWYCEQRWRCAQSSSSPRHAGWDNKMDMERRR